MTNEFPTFIHSLSIVDKLRTCFEFLIIREGHAGEVRIEADLGLNGLVTVVRLHLGSHINRLLLCLATIVIVIRCNKTICDSLNNLSIIDRT